MIAQRKSLMKTKVWIAIWGLKDGGAEVLARTYADMVDQQAFEPTLVTIYPFENTANYQYAKAAGLKICSVFKKRNTVTRALRLLFGKWYIPCVLKRMLIREKPDAIHFNSQIASWFAPLRKELSGIRLLYTCHSEPRKYFSEEEKQAVQQLVDDCDLQLIALHGDMKVELDQLFSTNNTVVIRNGVDFRRFRMQASDPAATRKSLGIAQDAYVVGHVGRLSAVKNHMFLLQVFQEIVARKPNAHLLLVGSGELKEQIKEQIKQQHLVECVTLISHRTDVPDLLRIMDVMVFPSLFEGLSVTLVEAQASGLKCVISDAINSANLLSPQTIPVSLNAPVKTWADIILDDTIRNEDHGDLEAYDMNREIHRLERLYQGELDV